MEHSLPQNGEQVETSYCVHTAALYSEMPTEVETLRKSEGIISYVLISICTIRHTVKIRSSHLGRETNPSRFFSKCSFLIFLVYFPKWNHIFFYHNKQSSRFYPSHKPLKAYLSNNGRVTVSQSDVCPLSHWVTLQDHFLGSIRVTKAQIGRDWGHHPVWTSLEHNSVWWPLTPS